MYNTGEKMTLKKTTELFDKSNSFCRKLLKSLVEYNLLEWNGVSQSDPTQYYTINF